jgi:pimeloyl-ACP methyl ester carboxylesterase
MKNEHLIFLPGLDGTGLSAGPLLKIIPSGVATTIVHYPPDKLLSYEETVRCAADQFPAGTSPIVIAESFSGPVAVDLIASGRVAARGLVLCATFARSPHPLLFKILRLLGITSLVRPDIPEPVLRFILGREYAEKLIPLWKTVHAGVPAGIMNHRLSLMSGIDVRPQLMKIAIPCLYLQAANDRLVPSFCARDFRKHLACLEVRKIRGPHFILQAEPEACLAAICGFWQRHN